MSAPETPESIERCFVRRTLLTVETASAKYYVEHGPTDLNAPDESYPREFNRVDDECAAIPVTDVYGETTIFTRANAYIDKFTRKTVPPHHDKAGSLDGISHLQAVVRVDTDQTTYDLRFDTGSPPHDNPALDIPYLDAEVVEEGSRSDFDPDAVPEHIVQGAREVVDKTIDR